MASFYQFNACLSHLQCQEWFSSGKGLGMRSLLFQINEININDIHINDYE